MLVVEPEVNLNDVWSIQHMELQNKRIIHYELRGRSSFHRLNTHEGTRFLERNPFIRGQDRAIRSGLQSIGYSPDWKDNAVNLPPFLFHYINSNSLSVGLPVDFPAKENLDGPGERTSNPHQCRFLFAWGVLVDIHKNSKKVKHNSSIEK